MIKLASKFLLAFALISSLAAHAQAGPNTKVWLISDVSSVTPGSKIWVGIQFKLEPGWHIYWVNPGDSGEPAQVNWHLPAAWTAGPIHWPVPERLSNPAGVDYGFEGEPLLLSQVQVPKDALLGTFVLNADLRWLICKDMCISQKGPASLIMQVVKSGAKPDSDGAQKIAAVRAKFPKPLPPEWKPNVMTNPTSFLFNFMPGIKVEKAEFFPLDKEVIENAAPQKLSATSMRAQLALKKDAEAKQAKAFRGVLVVNDSDAYSVDLPIKGSHK